MNQRAASKIQLKDPTQRSNSKIQLKDQALRLKPYVEGFLPQHADTRWHPPNILARHGDLKVGAVSVVPRLLAMTSC